jgi:nucleoside-diphosphate-sugar epimerase
MVYGRGRGFNQRSVQVPMLVRQAKNDGVARYIGRGLNVWSNVHIDDLVDLYLLALEKAAAGSFFFAENGEAQLKSIVEEIGRRLNLPATTWTEVEAIGAFGREAAVFALGSNSRVKAKNARERLGWRPRTNDILGSIKEEIA